MTSTAWFRRACFDSIPHLSGWVQDETKASGKTSGAAGGWPEEYRTNVRESNRVGLKLSPTWWGSPAAGREGVTAFPSPFQEGRKTAVSPPPRLRRYSPLNGGET